MIEVRELEDRADLTEAVRLQKQIWGFEEIDLLPLRLFVVATRIGGNVLGAFDASRMVGFSIAIPGVKPGGKAYWHSHMMGVTAEYRDRGVGRMLKFKQRDAALDQGIDLIEWTFDPLELKNAYFNIERLGVIIRRYVLNQYGTTSSHLHGALPTDRCVAEWHLNTQRGRGPHVSRIAVPIDIAEIRHSAPERARSIQAQVSSGFVELLGSGLAVTGFERTPQEGIYLFERWQSESSE